MLTCQTLAPAGAAHTLPERAGAGCFPLPLAPLGESLRVVALPAGKQTSQRLAAMGMTPGCELRVVQRSGDKLVIALGNARLALSAGIVHKLIVTAAAHS